MFIERSETKEGDDDRNTVLKRRTGKWANGRDVPVRLFFFYQQDKVI